MTLVLTISSTVKKRYSFYLLLLHLLIPFTSLPINNAVQHIPYTLLGFLIYYTLHGIFLSMSLPLPENIEGIHWTQNTIEQSLSPFHLRQRATVLKSSAHVAQVQEDTENHHTACSS